MSIKRDKRLRRIAKLRRRATINNDYRLIVSKSLRYIYAQLLDPNTNRIITSASSLEKKDEFTTQKISKMDAAYKVGQLIAEKAKKKGVDKVVFDRAGYKYHGKVKSLAQGARDAGLEF